MLGQNAIVDQMTPSRGPGFALGDTLKDPAMPTISVVMSVYNAMPYLTACLDSIAQQTFADFECILVDDASEDGSAAVLKSAAEVDARIQVLTNSENIGLTRSLNKALEVATGKYIARIDADDLCHPDRLKRQFAFMEQHPDVIACASGYRMIDAKGRRLRTSKRGMDAWQTKWMLSFNPPAPHPTYFFRRIDPLGNAILYNAAFRTAQDYELWTRLNAMGQTCVLQDVLIDYRRHDKAITFARRSEQAANCAKIGVVQMNARYPEALRQELTVLADLFAYKKRATPELVADAVAGAEAMLRFDTADAGKHRQWLRRKVAAVLAEAVLSRGGGARDIRSLMAFLYHARRNLPWLALEVAREPALALKSLRSSLKI